MKILYVKGYIKRRSTINNLKFKNILVIKTQRNFIYHHVTLSRMKRIECILHPEAKQFMQDIPVTEIAIPNIQKA